MEGRPELVGKRFLCVSGEEPLGRGEISRWGWRAGVIRAVTSRDIDAPDFSVRVSNGSLHFNGLFSPPRGSRSNCGTVSHSVGYTFMFINKVSIRVQKVIRRYFC